MSPSITQCPECATRFQVTEEQIAAQAGMVRCGRCNAVFNATEHLHDDEPSPQLNLPITPAEDEAVATKHIDYAPDPDELIGPLSENIPDESEALAEQMLVQEEGFPDEITDTPPRQRRWPWVIASLLLLLTLSAQVLYFYRVEIAAQLPGLKPALTGYCGLLKCTIPLPKKPDLMSIESSDLEADPLKSNVITLSALLRNRASHTQAYPSLELSLTDIQDKIVARRTFMPSEYLKTGENEILGLAANREMSIKLRLDTTELRPSGYKLFLFYPQ